MIEKYFFSFSYRHHCVLLFALHMLMLLLLAFQPVQANSVQRPFYVVELPKAKLTVRTPAKPEWEMQTDQRKGTYAVLMNTPENYYPMAVMEYIYNYRLKVPEGQQKQTALSAMNVAMQKLGINQPLSQSDLTPKTYGKITGYEHDVDFTNGGQHYSAKVMVGVFDNHRPITLQLITPKGQLAHISHMQTLMWEQIEPIQ